MLLHPAVIAFWIFSKNRLEIEEGIEKCKLAIWQQERNEFWHKYECLKQQEKHNKEAKC